MGRRSESTGKYKRSRRKYAVIGFVLTKFVLPVVKKQAKKSARKAAQSSAKSAARSVTEHPGRTSIAVGAAVGATGWLLTRHRRDAADSDDSET